MTSHAARELVTKNLDEVIGYSYHRDYPQYRWVVRRGTAKLPGQAGWTCCIFKVMLPKANESQLFQDDFACTAQSFGTLQPPLGWARPGRGEGLGDQLTDVDMIQSVDPGDLQQGGLGDCWLLSSFAALCEFPHEVRKLVTPNVLAKDGKYTVNLYDYGQKKVVPVVVDDRIPMGQGGLPLFTGFSKDDEIWPCILEKAVAKLAGSYANIDGADPLFALGMLTGTDPANLREYVQNSGSWTVIQPGFKSANPHDKHEYLYGSWPDGATGDQAKHWSSVLKLMAEYDQKDYIMCAGTHAGSDKDVSSFGIVQGHAYTVISVQLNVAGSGRDMLELRNPWGTGEWKGDWSDESDLWKRYPRIKQALNFEFEDDGIFWMEAKDFFENYSTVQVCLKTMPKSRGKKARQEAAARDAKESAQAPPSAEAKKMPPPPKPPLRKTLQAKASVKASKLMVEIPGPETVALGDGSSVTVSRPPSVSLEEWAVMKETMKAKPDEAKRMEAFSKDATAVRNWLASKAMSAHYMNKIHERDDAGAHLLGLMNSKEFGFIFRDMMEYGVQAAVKKYAYDEPLMRRLSKALGGLPGDVLGDLEQLQEKPVTLHEACKMGDVKAIKEYVSAATRAGNLDLEIKDSKGVSCLAYAIGANRIAIVKLLLEQKADLKSVDSKGGSGLHYAAAYGRKELLEFFCGSGVSVNATNEQGLTPLALATKNRQQDAIDILKKKGAK
mmetsp:Transcript_59395/g.159040  ORF Transcript_59395/g.159040 Transcript_59395/m.159040 type:complete len:723 (-) Transcript_59395:66-2234(-)